MSTSANHQPPKLATKLLLWMLREELVDEVLGDLHEEYVLLIESSSISNAKRRYWYQTINYIRLFAVKPYNIPLVYQLIHIKEHLWLFFRSILSVYQQTLSRLSTYLVGMTSFILICLYILHETGHDCHYKSQKTHLSDG